MFTQVTPNTLKGIGALLKILHAKQKQIKVLSYRVKYNFTDAQ